MHRDAHRRTSSLAALGLAAAGLATTGLGVTSAQAAEAEPAQQVAVVTSEARAAKITIVRTSARRLAEGRASTFTGTAPTTLRGRKVTLQRKVGGGKWKDVKTARVTAKGTYRISGRTVGAGVNRWRTYGVTKVVKQGRKTREVKAWSASTAMFSLQWFDLFDAQRSTRHNFSRYEADLGGTSYRRSLGPRGGVMSGWVQYGLAGRCDSFRATIGQDDVSLPGTRSQFLSRVDGVETDHGIRGKGKPVTVQLELTGRQKLRLISLRVTEEGYYWGMWGNPKVLCHRQP